VKIANKILSATFLIAAISTGAHANLIQNGGFEDIGSSTAIGGYGSASTWQIYSSIPEWDATRTMEVWTNDFIIPAYEGNNVIELNAHPSHGQSAFSISQSFVTDIGQEYELSFAGRKRQKNSDEAFSVAVGDLAESIHNQAWGTWTEYSYTFTATSIESTLIFTSLDHQRDTTGNVFDAVSITSVPEPGPLALLSAGLIGLVISRKKQSNS